MTFGIVALVLFAIIPAIVAIVLDVRSRRDAARFRAVLDEERRETAIRYAGDDEITARRQSFSAWPWAHRDRR